MKNLLVKLAAGFKKSLDLQRSLKIAGVVIAETGKDILNLAKFEEYAQDVECELALVRVAELGFPNGGTFSAICASAFQRGLALCPPEIAPQLCLQQKRELTGKIVVVGTQPIFDPIYRDHHIFLISDRNNNGQLWLYSTDGHSERFWDGHCIFVFALPPKV